MVLSFTAGSPNQKASFESNNSNPFKRVVILVNHPVSWRAPPEPKMADDWPKPLLRQGIWTNCFPSGRTTPVVWFEGVTRERSTRWTPRAVTAARRRPASCRRLLHWVNPRRGRIIRTGPLNPNLPPLQTHPQAAVVRHKETSKRPFFICRFRAKNGWLSARGD
jgi:hypothetical protein